MENNDRIQNWRQGRAQEAKVATEERAAIGREGRQEDSRMEEAQRRDIAESLLPTPDSVLLEQKAALDRRHARENSRRMRFLLLFGLPTLLIAIYATFIATPFYESEASFTINTINDNGPAQGLGILGAGAGSGTLSDAYKVREYLLSREAMALMEKRQGYLSHFNKGLVDPLSRPIVIPALGIDRSDYYRRRVHITVDQQEGLVKLKVQALTADDAAKFAEEMLNLGREKVTSISDRLNTDQIEALQQNVIKAQADVRRAASNVGQVQRIRGDVDPQQSSAAVYQLVSNFEVQLAEAESERSGLLANGLTESPLLPRLNARIAALNRQISQQKGRLVGGSQSVQRTMVDMETATAQKKLADSSLESMLRTLESARLRALEQRRYFVVVAEPVAPDTATVGRAPYLILLTALLALLAFGLATIFRRVRQLRTV